MIYKKQVLKRIYIKLNNLDKKADKFCNTAYMNNYNNYAKKRLQELKN